MGGDKLQSIQALRGIAALAVVVYHGFQAATVPYASPIGDAIKPWIARYGLFGVDVFFVISGFIIAVLISRSHAQGPAISGYGRPIEEALQFLVRRALRVYPAFWATIAATFGVLWGLGLYTLSQIGIFLDPEEIFLVKTHSKNLPSWSLTYELRFYLIAACAICFGQHARMALLIWAGLQTVVVSATAVGMIPGIDIFQDAQTLEFVIGMLLGFYPRMWAKLPSPKAVALIATLMALYLVQHYPILGHGFPRLLGFGLPAAFLVWAALSWEAQGSRPAGSFSFLGDISYSIYIWHILIIFLVDLALRPIGPGNWQILAFFSASIAATLLVATASYYLIERPTNRFGSRYFGASRPSVSRMHVQAAS